MSVRCYKNTWRGFRPRQCTRTGTHEFEGRWFCKQHHPPTKDARDEERKNDALGARMGDAMTEKQIDALQQQAYALRSKHECMSALIEALTELLAEAEDGIATCPLTREKAREALRMAQGGTR